MRATKRQTEAVRTYAEGQASEQVIHLEKVASELVGPVRHDIWDVHCADGRWWVITEPTNLYSQEDSKSRDVALTFHIGLSLRMSYLHDRRIPVDIPAADLLPGTWRRWEQAFEPYESGDEAENFQAVGVRLRECLTIALTRCPLGSERGSFTNSHHPSSEGTFVSARRNSHYLRGGLRLNLALVAGLVAVGVTAHSIAVLAEGGDYLLDAAGVGVALLAIRLASRPPTRARPAGYPHATSIAALINAGWLLVLELLVAGAAVDRLATRRVPVDGLAVLVVSGAAAVVMLAGAAVLRGAEDDEEDGEQDLSMAAVLLDTVADAAAAAGVAVAGAVILATGGWYWLDPAVALTIAIVIAYHALALIRKVLTRLRPAAG